MDTKVLNMVLADFKKGLDEKEQTLMEHKSEIYAKIPKIYDIDRKIKSNLSKAALLAFQQGGDISKAVEALKDESLALRLDKFNLLNDNGYPNYYLEIQYDCSKCLDTGYVGSNICPCLKRAYVKKQMDIFAKILNVKEQNFNNFQLSYYPNTAVKPFNFSARDNMKHIFASVKNYAENFSLDSDNLLFYGTSGLGKTFLSAAVAGEVIQKGFFVVYDSMISVAEAFEEEKFKDRGDTNRFFNCDLLIIDDLGTEMASSFTVSTVYNIINRRINDKKPTIINTNLSLSELEKRYSPAIASRLTGEFKPNFFVGEDIRKIKNK